MVTKTVGAARFKAECLQLIDGVARDGEPVTITKRGVPMAILSPVAKPNRGASIFGALRGTVLRFDDPFSPASKAEDWDSLK